MGAGIGALSFELLATGAERVTVVEAAPAYIAASAIRFGVSCTRCEVWRPCSSDTASCGCGVMKR